MNGLTQKVETRPVCFRNLALPGLFVSFFAFLDLFSKYYAIKLLGYEKGVSFIPNLFDWVVTKHIGSSFTISHQEVVNHYFSILVVALLTLFIFFLISQNFPRIAKGCLVLIAAGGVANMVDKIYNSEATNIICSIEQASHMYSICFNAADLFVGIGLTVGFIYNFYYVFKLTIKNTFWRNLALFPFIASTPFLFFHWLIFSF